MSNAMQIVKEPPDPDTPGDRYTVTVFGGGTSEVRKDAEGTYTCSCPDFAAGRGDCVCVQFVKLGLGEPY